VISTTRYCPFDSLTPSPPVSFSLSRSFPRGLYSPHFQTSPFNKDGSFVEPQPPLAPPLSVPCNPLGWWTYTSLWGGRSLDSCPQTVLSPPPPPPSCLLDINLSPNSLDPPFPLCTSDRSFSGLVVHPGICFRLLSPSFPPELRGVSIFGSFFPFPPNARFFLLPERMCLYPPPPFLRPGPPLLRGSHFAPKWVPPLR